MAAAVDLRDLDIRVGRRTLVHGIDLLVHRGERVALLGPSGSGKSLTTSAVLGSLGPAYRVRGRLHLAGSSVELGRATGRDGLAAVHQASATALNPLVTVGGQLIGVIRAHRRCSRAQARAHAVDLLAGVDIAEPGQLLRRYPAELSGGQRQRVCIAVALACRPRLLVADEPTTALDTVAQARVVETLDSFGTSTGAALLLVTHDREVARALCSRAVLLEDGHVVGEEQWQRGDAVPPCATPRGATTAVA